MRPEDRDPDGGCVITPGGAFVGFRRACRNCGQYFRPTLLNEDGWCYRCEPPTKLEAFFAKCGEDCVNGRSK